MRKPLLALILVCPALAFAEDKPAPPKVDLRLAGLLLQRQQELDPYRATAFQMPFGTELLLRVDVGGLRVLCMDPEGSRVTLFQDDAGTDLRVPATKPQEMPAIGLDGAWGCPFVLASIRMPRAPAQTPHRLAVEGTMRLEVVVGEEIVRSPLLDLDAPAQVDVGPLTVVARRATDKMDGYATTVALDALKASPLVGWDQVPRFRFLDAEGRPIETHWDGKRDFKKPAPLLFGLRAEATRVFLEFPIPRLLPVDRPFKLQVEVSADGHGAMPEGLAATLGGVSFTQDLKTQGPFAGFGLCRPVTRLWFALEATKERMVGIDASSQRVKRFEAGEGADLRKATLQRESDLAPLVMLKDGGRRAEVAFQAESFVPEGCSGLTLEASPVVGVGGQEEVASKSVALPPPGADPAKGLPSVEVPLGRMTFALSGIAEKEVVGRWHGSPPRTSIHLRTTDDPGGLIALIVRDPKGAELGKVQKWTPLLDAKQPCWYGDCEVKGAVPAFTLEATYPKREREVELPLSFTIQVKSTIE